MSKRSATKRPRKGSTNRPPRLTLSSGLENPNAWSLPTNPPSTPESSASSTGEPDDHHDFFRTGDAGSYPEGPANAALKSDHWPEAELPTFVRTPAMDARRARNKKIVWWSVAVLLPLNVLAVLSGLSRNARDTSGAVAREVRRDTPSEPSKVAKGWPSPASEQPTPPASQLSPAPIVALPKDTSPKVAPAPPQAEPNPASVSNPPVSSKVVQRPRAALPASAPHPAPVPVAPSGPRPTAAFPIL